MKYYEIDKMLVSAENEHKALKMYKAMFHKKALTIKEVARPS